MATITPTMAKDRDAQPDLRPQAIESAGATQLAQAGSAADYDIPAQDLSGAVTTFGRQSGLQVVVDSAILSGLRSQPVAGHLTTEEAINQMLAGTGLTWRYTDTGTVALERQINPGADSGNGLMALPPVTVTAERSERSIMDTSTSVQVFDADTLQERPDMEGSNDVLSKVANVTSVGTGNFAPSVRGVDGTGPAQGADAFLAGTRPRLNVQVDGRPLSYNEVVFGDVSMWDVEQVEVLRGAQTTLQGRNAIAGTVAITSKAPVYDFEVGGRALGGDDHKRYLSAMINAPIIDNELAVRFSVDHQRHESFVEGFNNIENAGDPSDFESLNFRGKVLVEPEAWEGFKATFTLNHNEYTAPQTESVERPFDEYEAAFPDMPVFNPSTTTGVLDASWQINDNWAVENTTSVSGVDIQRKALDGDGNAEIDALEIVSEPRVRFTGLDGNLKILGGVYVFHNEQDEVIDLFGGGAFDDSTDTVAVFSEMTWTFLEDFDLTLGARYENEQRRRTGEMFVFAIDLDETYDAFLPKAGLAWHPTEEFTVGIVGSRGYNGGGAGFTYDFPFESYVFKPEYVWTAEAYSRAELFDKRLSLTGNVFYSWYKDMQLPFDLNPDPDIWAFVIRNADRVETYGAEIGMRWLAMPGLEFFADAGYLETEITKYSGSDLVGNDLAVAPNFTADVGVIYQHESGFEFALDARYTGDYFSSVENDPYEEIDSYWIVNAQMGYVWGDDRNVRLFGFVNNLLDADDITTLEKGATPADDSAGIIPPRSFGVGLEVYF
ncbi:MAG TPA: TonB-dependent receptor [Dongiaceae bacterium]|nr:TonB-dependent receptor [Dongiaceae bacterium]